MLVFAGYQHDRPRTLDALKLRELVREYQDLNHQKTNNLFNGKPLDQLNQDELSLLRDHMMSTRQAMKGILAEALTKNGVKNGLIELPISDHHVFAVEIKCGETDDKIFKYIDCGWGEYVVRGGSLDNGAISRDFFGDLDFNANSGDLHLDNRPFVAWISNYYSSSIGGAVTNFILFDNKILQTTGVVTYGPRDNPNSKILYGTDVINGHLHRLNEKGEWQKLVPLSHFSDSGDCLL